MNQSQGLRITEDLQPYLVARAAELAGVREGATVRMDAENIQIKPIGVAGQALLVWCYSNLRITDVLKEGTGGHLALLSTYDLWIPDYGNFNAKDLLVHFNGTVHVYQDNQTRFVRSPQPAYMRLIG